MPTESGSRAPFRWFNAAVPLSLVIVLVSSWSFKHLPLATALVAIRPTIDPEKDEFFHVRQAQKYCTGDIYSWDPKITTPPGLYAVSWILSHLRNFRSCTIESLRSVNVYALCVVFLISVSNGRRIEIGSRIAGYHAGARSPGSWRVDQHVAFNICLFPPLFFFSALYYTDVISTASVLLQHWIRTGVKDDLYCLRSLSLFMHGLVALTFRQTNIFWVALLPAMLDVIDDLSNKVGVMAKQPRSSTDYREFYKENLDGQSLHDLPIGSEELYDYPAVVISTAACAYRHWRSLLPRITPYIALVLSFVGFVLWNGGVVLGDKSNHVATVHLSQMLYLWPLITFFSWPLLMPHMLAYFLEGFHLPDWLAVYRRSKPPWKKAISPSNGVKILALLGLAIAIVRYNTIVHPFTLADNRHYVFYIFRILLRHSSIRYLVIPVYLFCGWAALRALSKPCSTIITSYLSGYRTLDNVWLRYDDHERQEPKPVPKGTGFWRLQREHEPKLRGTTPVSYVLAWLATTAASLITAPLVEPRYFILPWLFWRLSVPAPAAHTVVGPSEEAFKTMKESFDTREWLRTSLRREDIDAAKVPSRQAKMKEIEALDEKIQTIFDDAEKSKTSPPRRFNGYDHRLWLETIWFLLINAVTGYIFLYKGFEWPQEPGNVQRFMW